MVPTRQAEASRAIVGGNTIAENYAFVGVRHIFDQVLLFTKVTIRMVSCSFNEDEYLHFFLNKGLI